MGALRHALIQRRRPKSLELRRVAVAYGVAAGCRIVRVHDVPGSTRVCRTLDALLAAPVPEALAS